MTVPLAQYLFTRLRQLGIESIFGVPSDYNLRALDYISPAGLQWVGDANELNAGYAADGYARLKGISCLMTAFGVGELSALNAIAGAYAEYVPIIHIAGSPSRHIQASGACVHHSLGNGDFGVFKRVAGEFAVAMATLGDPQAAPAEIDRVLLECWKRRRPVYLELPVDMIAVEVDGTALSAPLDMSFPRNPAEKEHEIVQQVFHRLANAKNPVILADSLVHSLRLNADITALVQQTGIPTFATPGGRGAVEEDLSNFGGVYAGAGSAPDVRLFVDGSDCVISIGSFRCDFNTAGFTFGFSVKSNIDIGYDYVSIGSTRHTGVHPWGIIRALRKCLRGDQLSVTMFEPVGKGQAVNGTFPSSSLVSSPSDAMTQSHLWSTLHHHLRPYDILLAENGTPSIATWNVKLCAGARAILQPLWGSIGYALPAAQGTALAVRELSKVGKDKRRVVLFQGDGSFQLTSAAIGTMAKHNLDIVIILLNNSGYTIERFVHPSGFEEEYNDIAEWDYQTTVKGMCGIKKVKEGYLKTSTVKTKHEWDTVMESKEIKEGKGLKFVEVYLDKADAPEALKVLTEAALKRNRGG